MKTIGLIGGMSWESSLEYYRIINEQTKLRLGGLHSAKILLYSVDFFEIERLQHSGRWDEATEIMIDAAERLERGGAEFILICTNTMHKMANEVQNAVKIPLLHIADATADKIISAGKKRVALLGTKFTMEQDFYKGRLFDKYGLDVLTPDEDERNRVHRIIYNELCLGNISQNSKESFIEIIGKLVKKGAEAVILGCTEIPLLIQQNDVEVLLLDTTKIHAEAAVDYAILSSF